MDRPSRRGESLIELLVALILLEIIGAAALAAALTSERMGSHAARGAADDAARWTAYRAAEGASSCPDSGAPAALVFTLPATNNRTALVTQLRCGR